MPAATPLCTCRLERMSSKAGGDSRGAVLDCGADVFIDCRSEDFQAVVAQATQGRGVDVVIDFIGAPYLQRNVRSLADGGRLVSVGLLGGGAQGAELPVDVVLYRHLLIFGTVMKSRPPEVKQAMVQPFAQQWLPALAAGVIRSVIDSTFALADAVQAYRSAHGVWRQHWQDPVVAPRELSWLRPAPHLCGTGLPGPSAWPRLGPPQPAAARLRHAANTSSSVLYASVFTSIRPSTEWK